MPKEKRAIAVIKLRTGMRLDGVLDLVVGEPGCFGLEAEVEG